LPRKSRLKTRTEEHDRSLFFWPSPLPPGWQGRRAGVERRRWCAAPAASAASPTASSFNHKLRIEPIKTRSRKINRKKKKRERENERKKDKRALHVGGKTKE